MKEKNGFKAMYSMAAKREAQKQARHTGACERRFAEVGTENSLSPHTISYIKSKLTESLVRTRRSSGL